MRLNQIQSNSESTCELEIKKNNQLVFFDVAAAGVNVPCAEPAKHVAIQYALDLKLTEFSYRPVLPSLAGKTLLKWRFEEQKHRHR